MKKSSREELREQHRSERSSMRELDDALKLNLGANPDRFYEIIKGTYRPPVLETDSPKITAPLDSANFRTGSSPRTIRESDTDDSPARQVRPMRRAASQYQDNVQDDYTQQPSISKYAQIEKELDRIPFSDDEETRKHQMDAIANAIKSAAHEIRDAAYNLVCQAVATNTKRSFGKHVDKVFKVPGGLKVLFNFAGKKLAVTALGGFFGDEVICVDAENGKIRGSVVKANGQDKIVLNAFNVGVKEL